MKKIILHATMLYFVISTLTAQEWMQNIKTTNPNFYEIQSAFNAYWKDRPIEKGKGYNTFKRWEWYWEQRVGASGEFPPMDILMTEYIKYTKNKSVEKSLSATSSGNWSFEGSTNVSNPGTGTGIGRVTCIAFHPTNANTFWIGTPAGGLWKTTDGGQTWSSNTDNLPVLGVSDIAIHPTNPNIMYIATGDGDSRDTKSVGILKSIDGGTTWNITGMNWSVTSQKTIRRLIINPSNPQIVMAATSDGIWRTINGGTNWTQYESGKWFMDLEFKPTDPNYVYASTFDYYTNNAQIYTSTNGGAVWTQVTNLTGVSRIDMAVSSNSINLVDAVCSDSQYGIHSLIASTNSGASFSSYYTGNCTNNILARSTDASGCGGQAWYDLAYAINPANANEMWLGGINTWRTIDGGANWSLNNYWYEQFNPQVPVTHADKHFLTFHPLLPNTVYECNDGGIFKTTDGGVTWTDLTNGLGISQVYRVATSATTSNHVIFGLQDNGTKTLISGGFYDLTGGDGMEAFIDYSNSNIQFTSFQYGNIYKTSDAWQTTYNQIVYDTAASGIDEKGAWVTPYIMHPTDPNTLLVGKSQVYESNDGGTSWHALASIPGLSTNINQMAYAPSNPNIIYVSSTTEFYTTINGGSTWTSGNNMSENITYIAVNPTNPLNVYITVSGYSAGNKVFTSTDGGATWINISGTLPNVPVNCIVYQTNSNGGLYIGTDLGVYYRDGSMTDWIAYNTGLPNVIVNELEISYINNKIWAGTYGRGLWSSGLYNAITTDIVKNELTATVNILPNPSSGIFSVMMKDSPNTFIEVYNMLGKLIYKTKTTGVETILDLSSQSNGVYYVRVGDKNRSVTKKIILTH